MSKLPSALIFLTSIMAIATATGCGSNIGDSCTENKQCPDKCQTGGGFPGGICTKECDTNAECPDGWACISKSSGICVQLCTAASECTDAFGDGWTCDDESLQEGGGAAQVCIGI